MEKADILIVDDDPKVSKSICRVLKHHNFRILSAQNGQDALKIAKVIRFKMIISDVKMSGMNGFEILDRIHEIAPQTTRMVLSGHTDVELILKLVNEKGIDRYLVKPWENKDLNLAVSSAIEYYDIRMGLQNSESGSAIRA